MSRFFDTNIFVYAFSDDRRQAKAREVLADGGVISAQILNELANVLRKKQRAEWRVVEAVLATVRGRFDDILPLTSQTHLAALALAKDHGLNIYDALIVASALEAKCAELVSEDLQHGRVFGALRVVNPFLAPAVSAPT